MIAPALDLSGHKSSRAWITGIEIPSLLFQVDFFDKWHTRLAILSSLNDVTFHCSSLCLLLRPTSSANSVSLRSSSCPWKPCGRGTSGPRQPNLRILAEAPRLRHYTMFIRVRACLAASPSSDGHRRQPRYVFAKEQSGAVSMTSFIAIATLGVSFNVLFDEDTVQML